MRRSDNILIIGSIPPPIGGVTIHLQRLMASLKQQSVDFAFYDYKKESLVSGFRKVLSSRTVHLHFSSKILRLFVTLLLRMMNKQVIATFHGKYSFSHAIDRTALKLLSHALVLNEFSYHHALARLPAKHGAIHLVSAFIPPTRDEEPLPAGIGAQIQKLAADKALLACTNATSYVEDHQGKDLYGIDFLLKVFTAQSNWALVISDPSGQLQQRYAAFRTVRNILFISTPHPFVEVIKKSDVFIRATRSDGDSISVKEALFYDVKVVASDCVDRPEGCHVYLMENTESFVSKLREPKNHTVQEIKNGAAQMIDLYKKISIK